MELLLMMLICTISFLLGWILSYKVNFKKLGSELGSLDAPADSHGCLLDVGESHASGSDTTEDSEHTSDEAFGKIIEAKEDFRFCKYPNDRCKEQCQECKTEQMWGHENLVDS